tara:strand:- start:327 stop:749 length:423 start_codon:yes stop_codon:yes gene_type:complete
MKKSLFAILFLVSCASEDTQSILPCEKNPDTITGQYEIITTESDDGTCGSMGEMEITINSGVPQVDDGLGCSLVENEWVDTTCANRSVYECDDGEWVMRLEWFVSVTQEGLITGELWADMDRWNGIYTCSSVYSFVSEGF